MMKRRVGDERARKGGGTDRLRTWIPLGAMIARRMIRAAVNAIVAVVLVVVCMLMLGFMFCDLLYTCTVMLHDRWSDTPPSTMVLRCL